MNFSSVLFIFCFLPAAVFMYFLMKPGFRNFLLLAASLIFYSWVEKEYVLIFLILMLVTYSFSYLIHRWHERSPKRAYIVLVIAVIAILAFLGFYKYINFLTSNVNLLFTFFKLSPVNWRQSHLPIGISFFTFQAISYLIDIYRKDAEFNPNPLYFFLYLSFFPKILSGPIDRFASISVSIENPDISFTNMAYGVKRFIIGLGKKLLIANTLAGSVDLIFSIPPENMQTSIAWMGTVLYTLQIYFDFSGYTDMAVGIGRMFGFKLMENFNYPYISTSIQDFWRRWHISLSKWFRDYLYFPLGGNRRGTVKTYFNLLTVFTLCGLWHGASWTFLIWGLYHGFFLVLERTQFGNILKKAWAPLQWAYAILVITVGWVFFRASSLSSATAILKAMVGFGGSGENIYSPAMYINSIIVLAIAAGVAGSAPVLPWISMQMKKILQQRSITDSTVLGYIIPYGQTVFILIILFLSIITAVSTTNNPFIYFNF